MSRKVDRRVARAQAQARQKPPLPPVTLSNLTPVQQELALLKAGIFDRQTHQNLIQIEINQIYARMTELSKSAGAPAPDKPAG